MLSSQIPRAREHERRGVRRLTMEASGLNRKATAVLMAVGWFAITAMLDALLGPLSWWTYGLIAIGAYVGWLILKVPRALLAMLWKRLKIAPPDITWKDVAHVLAIVVVIQSIVMQSSTVRGLLAVGWDTAITWMVEIDHTEAIPATLGVLLRIVTFALGLAIVVAAQVFITILKELNKWSFEHYSLTQITYLVTEPEEPKPDELAREYSLVCRDVSEGTLLSSVPETGGDPVVTKKHLRDYLRAKGKDVPLFLMDGSMAMVLLRKLWHEISNRWERLQEGES